MARRLLAVSRLATILAREGLALPSRQEELRDRTKKFALQVMLLLRALPQSDPPAAIRNQLLKSATSMAANYRSTGRSRSRREFASRLALVMEESDETVFWLELLSESATSQRSEIAALLRESRELVAIFAASHRTVTHGRSATSELDEADTR